MNTSRMRNLLAVVAIAAGLLVGLVGADRAGATCALDAHIAAQQAVIADLQAQLAGADARTAFVLNAQIAARQAAVADMQAQCA